MMKTLNDLDNRRSERQLRESQDLELTSTKKHDSDTKDVTDLIQGTDKPMEDVSPEAPAALVLGSYPIILIVFVAMLVVIGWLLGLPAPFTNPAP